MRRSGAAPLHRKEKATLTSRQDAGATKARRKALGLEGLSYRLPVFGVDAEGAGVVEGYIESFRFLD